MKHVVQYKLHGGEVPYFIEDGGFYPNGGKLIGLTKDDEGCYVPPDTELVTYHTLLSFQDYLASLTLYKFDMVTAMSEAEKRAEAEAWWDARH